MVNKLLINFTYLRKISVFGFALETGASRAGNFCCPGRPQISSFSLTMQRYKIFKALPNYSAKKARKKARSSFFEKNFVECGHYGHLVIWSFSFWDLYNQIIII